MDRLSYKTLFLIIIFLLIPIVFLAKIQQKGKSVLAEWWNDSWSYRQAINVTSHTSPETDVYITATVNIGSTLKAQPDDGDFRFTDSSGNLLEYFIFSNAGTTAPTFHILIPSFPAGAQTFYAYYGNSSAENGFSLTDFSTHAANYAFNFLTEQKGGAPVAHWKMDEGSWNGTANEVKDSSSNAIHGTRGGAATTTSGKYGNAGVFDGAVSYAQMSNHPALQITENISLSAWIYPGDQNTYGHIIVKNSADTWTGSFGYYRLVMEANEYIRFEIANGSNGMTGGVDGEVVQTTSAISTNQWHHVVGTYDGAYLKIYIDGVLNNSKALSNFTIGSAPYPLHIGINDDNSNEDFIGKIDEVKIYNYARSESQVKIDYNSPVSSGTKIGSESQDFLTDKLIGYWPLDETASPSIDKSNSGHNGTWTNSPASGSGKFGNAINLNGTNQYVSMGDQTKYDLTLPFSLFAWINMDQLPSTKGTDAEIISKYSGAPNRQWTLAIGTDNGLYFWKSHNGTNGQYSTSYTFTAADVGKWIHVGFTADAAGKTRMFINGKQVSSGQFNDLTMYGGGSASLLIGARSNPANYFDGRIDEARIYNKTFTSNEVDALYNYSPGPVGYWKMDENSGSTINDSSGNNNNSTSLTGSVSFAPGKLGSASDFGGTDDYFTINSSTTLDNLQAYTFSMWLKPRTGASSNIIDKSVNTNNGWKIGINSNKYDFNVNYTGTDLNCVGPNLSVTTDTWQHITWTWDGTSSCNGVKLYKNGQNLSFGSTSVPTGTRENDTGKNILIGGNTYDDFSGLIDDFKIYNYVRSASQITQDLDGTTSTSLTPILYWKLDEGQGTTINNSSANSSNNGTFAAGSSSPTWTTAGIVNKALTFDGNDYITLSPLLNSNSFTASFWINPTSTSDNSVFYSNTNSDNGWAIAMDRNSGDCDEGDVCVWLYGNSTGGYIDFPYDLPANTWSHLSATYSQSTGLVSIYINGVLKHSETTTWVPDTSTAQNSFLSRGNPAWSPADMYLNGKMDEVQVYNHDLTSSQIKSLFNQNSSTKIGQSSQTIGSTTTSLEYCIPGDTSPCNPPIGEWKFNENIGTSVFDTSGNGNNAVMSGDTLNAKSWKPGKVGSALLFGGDGTDDQLNAGDPASGIFDFGSTDSFSISFWTKIKPDTVQNQSPVSKGGSPGWRFRHSTVDQTMYFQIRDGTFTPNATTVLPVADDRWHHIVGVRDVASDTIKIYMDGVLQESSTDTTTAGFANSSPLIISDFADEVRGLLDEVKIYNYARTPAQVAYDYNKGSPIAWWKFDECQGAVANDSSGIGNSGLITIGTLGSQASAGTCNLSASTAWNNGSVGKFNSSISFDGTDDVVNIFSSKLSSSFNPTQGSVSVWFKMSPAAWADTSSNRSIFQIAADTSNYIRIVKSTTANQLNINYAAGGVVDGSDYSTTDTSNWMHVVLTWNKASERVNVYINGKYYDGTSNLGTWSGAIAATRANIGARLNNATDPFNGQVDDVRLFNYPLTSSQVKQIYSGGSVNFR